MSFELFVPPFQLFVEQVEAGRATPGMLLAWLKTIKEDSAQGERSYTKASEEGLRLIEQEQRSRLLPGCNEPPEGTPQETANDHAGASDAISQFTELAVRYSTCCTKQGVPGSVMTGMLLLQLISDGVIQPHEFEAFVRLIPELSSTSTH